jgi:hypothetical protein
MHILLQRGKISMIRQEITVVYSRNTLLEMQLLLRFTDPIAGVN